MNDERTPDHHTGGWRRRIARVRSGEATTSETLALLGATLGAALVAWLFLAPVLALLWQVRLAMLDPAAIGEGGTPLRDAALILAAVLGAPFVIWRTITAHWQAQAARRQSDVAEGNRALTEDRNLTDRFIKAVEMLGAGTPEVPILEQRLGGIYALEKLAQESDKHHIQIMEVLCAYVRTNAPASAAREFPGTVLNLLVEEYPAIDDEEIMADPDFAAAIKGCGFTLADLSSDPLKCLSKWAAVLPPPREDIRATLDVIGRRVERQHRLEDERSYRLDLRNTNLQRVAPSGKRFTGALFDNARLEGCDFSDAYLEGTSLTRAQISGAHLGGACLEDSNLDGAQLQHASLAKANLQAVYMPNAQLQGASFFEAHMYRIILDRSQLQGAWINGVSLEKASIARCELRAARIERSNFHNCLIGRAILIGSDFIYSSIMGESNFRMMFDGTNISSLKIDGGALRFVDLTRAVVEVPPDLRNAFGDRSVVLPASVSRPDHWPNEVLDDAQFLGGWRGWVEASPDPSRPAWSDIAPEGFEDIPAIPPPAGVHWVWNHSD